MNVRSVAMAVALAMSLASAKPCLAVGKGKAKYMGGMAVGVKEKAEGPFDLKGEQTLVWNGEGSRLEIPWTSIAEMEYGQKVARRWRSAILLSPIALLSKARKHFVTVSYKDSAGKDQAAVFEFDKDDIRQVLATLKARSGKDVTYQDEEAQKQMGGAKKEEK